MSRLDRDLLLAHAESVFAWALGTTWRPKGRGPEYACKCPFHDDRTPSFSANVTTGLWLCRAGCGGGDLIDLAARKLGLDAKRDFAAVVEGLERATGLRLRTESVARRSTTTPADNEALRNWGDPAGWPGVVGQAARQLRRGSAVVGAGDDDANARGVREYLERRAISLDVAEAARVGFVERRTTPISWWVPDGSAWTLLIPVFAGDPAKGRVIGFELRPEHGFPPRPGESKGRKAVCTGKCFFRAPTPTRRESYGRWVFLCEGPLDALAAASAGVRACSALPGASAWDQLWGEFLWNRWVCVAYDDDRGGILGGVRLAKALYPYACATRLADWASLRRLLDREGKPRFPALQAETWGKDVGDALKTVPADERRELLDALAESAVFDPRALRSYLRAELTEHLNEALTAAGAWPDDHGVRVLRNRYFVEGRAAKQAPQNGSQDAHGAIGWHGEEVADDESRLCGPLSDFAFRVTELRAQEDGTVKRWLVARGGCTQKPVEWAATAEDLSMPKAARTAFLARGDLFLSDRITAPQWTAILNREFKRLPLPTVREYDIWGRMDLGLRGELRPVGLDGPFVFGDAVIEKGVLRPIPAHRRMETAHGTLAIPEGNSGMIPRIMASGAGNDPGEVFRRMAGMWRGAKGDGAGPFRLACGWAAAATFIPELLGIGVEGFPLLFLCGQRQSGKNFLARRLRALWGFPMNQGDPPPYNTATISAMEQALADVSGLPVMFDEYAEDQSVKYADAKQGMLKAVFNRSLFSKGSVNLRTRYLGTRAALCLMGQHFPENNDAVASRAVIIEFHSELRAKDPADYLWLSRPEIDYASVGRHMALHAATLWPAFADAVRRLRDDVTRHVPGVGERTRDAVALCAAGWCAVTGDTPLSMIGDAVRHAELQTQSSRQIGALERFFEWCGEKMLAKADAWSPHAPRCVWKHGYNAKANHRHELRLWFAEGYRLYRKEMIDQRLPVVEKQELISLFRRAPYALAHDKLSWLTSDHQAACWVVDLAKAPKVLRRAMKAGDTVRGAAGDGGDEWEEDTDADGGNGHDRREHGMGHEIDRGDDGDAY